MPGNGPSNCALRREFTETLLAIVAAEVGHDPDPGQYLAFERSIPSVHVGASYAGEIERGRAGAVEGVADKNVPGRGHLCARQTREQKQSEGDQCNFAHADISSLRDPVTHDALESC